MEAAMLTLRRTALALTLLAAAPAFAADSFTPDSASFEFGTGTKTQLVRFGAQWGWQQKWFATNGSHLGGYWDATLAGWRGNAYQNVKGQRQSLADVGFTPVFRWQNDNKQGVYFEGGIGVHLLSKLYDNDGNQLSTHFQFGDHVGLGYVFGNKLDLGLKLQHFSNGGYKKPNTGANFIVAKASYAF